MIRLWASSTRLSVVRRGATAVAAQHAERRNGLAALRASIRASSGLAAPRESSARPALRPRNRGLASAAEDVLREPIVGGLGSTEDVFHTLRDTGSHIDLVQIDRLLFRASREQLWIPPGGRGVFGGQILGQALRAATLAVGVEKGWRVHSLHAYFLQAGDPARDVIYRVRETSTRRSFATRSVDGVQNGQIIFKMQSSFVLDTSRPEDPTPPSHQSAIPDGIPPPEELPSMRDSIKELLPRLPKGKIREEILRLCSAPIDMRFVNRPDPLDPDPPKEEPVRRMWIKVHPIDRTGRGHSGVDECCAAYTSDNSLLTTALLPHGLQLPSPKIGAVASLDHTMWFHAPFRADEWMLYDIYSPRYVDSRGLAIGSLYQNGVLVATVAQEGLLRLARPSTTRTAATWLMRMNKTIENALSVFRFRSKK